VVGKVVPVDPLAPVARPPLDPPAPPATPIEVATITCHIKPERFVEKTVTKSLKISVKKLEKERCEKPSECFRNARLLKMPKSK
jgi:hypothetical protein